MAGCSAQKAKEPAGIKIEEDVGRIITLPDGSTCTEPANMGEARQLPGALQVKELFASEARPEETLEAAKKLKVTDTEVEAAFFDVCRAYSKGEIKKEVFEKDRRIHLELRQALLAGGIKAWTDKKDGIKDPGKLCMVVFAGDTASSLNTTRWVPETTTVSDCALLAHKAGGSDVLLGCTEGEWKNHWARKTVAAGDLGTKSRNVVVRDTASAPEPNCGWL
ncbi:MAG TPA: hypothetical protein VF460_01995 [Burkholderiales bacterium]